MLRRSPAAWAGLLLVLALAAGCSGTTIISEGTLGSEPASNPGGDESASSEQAPPNPSEPSDELDAVEGDGAELSTLGLIGDDQITSLARDCEAGSDPACDILYQASTLGSPEEELARTCGGREPANAAFCTEGIEPAPEGIWFDEASPGLAALEQACLDGELTACDFLYFRSEIGSPYEEIGTTCGGRIDVAIPDCRTVLGDG